MTISYIKKANKTASSDEAETRKIVQDVLNEIESRRDEGIKDISRKFDNYEGDIIVSKEDKSVKDLINLLYESSLIESGFSLDEPSNFVNRIHKMIKLGLSLDDDDEEEEKVEELPPLEKDDEETNESVMEEVD